MGPRIILYTGKGGVGKTSVAAATARRAAANGQRVLILSTDPAGSLGDVLQQPVGSEETDLGGGLCGQQVEARSELERHWSEIQRWLVAVLTHQGVERLRAQELAMPPGLSDIAGLLELGRHAARTDLDLIVVDCAASGETLRLLAVPDAARWWLDRGIGGRRWDLARPFAKAALDISLPSGTAVEGAAHVLRALAGVYDILRDHERASVRLVMTPDRMVLAEARRTFTYLNLYAMLTDAVIINRVFPDDVGPYFAKWRDQHDAACSEIHSAFSPVPVLRAPFFDSEVCGSVMLDRLADATFSDIDDSAALLYSEVAERLELGANTATLRLALPFADKQDVSVRRVGDELIVSLAGHARTVLLPSALRNYRPNDAVLRDGALTVTLQAPS